MRRIDSRQKAVQSHMTFARFILLCQGQSLNPEIQAQGENAAFAGFQEALLLTVNRAGREQDSADWATTAIRMEPQTLPPLQTQNR